VGVHAGSADDVTQPSPARGEREEEAPTRFNESKRKTQRSGAAFLHCSKSPKNSPFERGNGISGGFSVLVRLAYKDLGAAPRAFPLDHPGG
jgi:hypothetical protein